MTHRRPRPSAWAGECRAVGPWGESLVCRLHSSPPRQGGPTSAVGNYCDETKRGNDQNKSTRLGDQRRDVDGFAAANQDVHRDLVVIERFGTDLGEINVLTFEHIATRDYLFKRPVKVGVHTERWHFIGRGLGLKVRRFSY